MKVKNYFLLCLVALVAITACKKSSTPKPGTNGSTGSTGTTGAKIDTDVYVVGSILSLNSKYVAVYWKNGVLTKLSDTTQNWYATGIAVNNGNIYVSGYKQIIDPNAGTTTHMAAYWVNGVEHDLSTTANATANGIGINNDGVYVIGSMNDGTNDNAVYWKDGGSIQLLPLKTGATYSETTGVYAIGHDFYIAGSNDNYAVYWKNGALIKSESRKSGSYAIASNGTQVYMVGSTSDYVPPSNYTDTATYWKDNGSAIYLTDGSFPAVAEAVAIDGSNNVYIAGYTTDASNNKVATYWKTETPIKTTIITDGRDLKGIAVVGNDVYVTGQTPVSASVLVAYWKNGVIKSLSRADRALEITGMVVITHPH